MDILSKNAWSKKLKRYHSLRNEIEVKTAEKQALHDDILAHMHFERTDRVEAGGFIATITVIRSTRLDSTRVKKERPELYEKYSVKSESDRLNVK